MEKKVNSILYLKTERVAAERDGHASHVRSGAPAGRLHGRVDRALHYRPLHSS